MANLIPGLDGYYVFCIIFIILLYFIEIKLSISSLLFSNLYVFTPYLIEDDKKKKKGKVNNVGLRPRIITSDDLFVGNNDYQSLKSHSLYDTYDFSFYFFLLTVFCYLFDFIYLYITNNYLQHELPTILSLILVFYLFRSFIKQSNVFELSFICLGILIFVISMLILYLTYKFLDYSIIDFSIISVELLSDSKIIIGFAIVSILLALINGILLQSSKEFVDAFLVLINANKDQTFYSYSGYFDILFGFINIFVISYQFHALSFIFQFLWLFIRIYFARKYFQMYLASIRNSLSFLFEGSTTFDVLRTVITRYNAKICSYAVVLFFPNVILICFNIVFNRIENETLSSTLLSSPILMSASKYLFFGISILNLMQTLLFLIFEQTKSDKYNQID